MGRWRTPYLAGGRYSAADAYLFMCAHWHVEPDRLFKDCPNIARLCDALPNMDFVMSMGIARERPGTSSFVHQYAALQEGTVKPIVLPSLFTAEPKITPKI